MVPNPRKRILCVDDQEDFWELLSVALSSYSIKPAYTFAEGLELARNQFFDLYVLDNWLPDGWGVDLCRQIRGFDWNTPVVFVSGAAYAADHEKALEAGATAYLNKPVDLIDLEALIGKLLKSADAKTLEARSIELAALSEEIRESSAGLRAISAGARERGRLANSRHREVAYAAFTRSGGSRSSFERLWPDILDELP
jgi:DNA-binding response OmpR family regulator